MSKMSTHYADMCSDEFTSKLFNEGVSKIVKAIKKKRNSMTKNVNAIVRTNDDRNHVSLDTVMFRNQYW